MHRSVFQIAARLALAPLLLSACSLPAGAPNTVPVSRSSFEHPLRAGAAPLSTTPLQHIVVIIQENRTFNDFFATYPGALGATTGKTHDGRTIQLTKVPLRGVTLSNGWQSFQLAYDGGKMDGFDLESWGGPGHAGKRPYTYVDPNQIKPYWDIARQYALGDEMFQGQGSGSFTAHQELIAGGEKISSTRALVNWPAPPHPGSYAWGCDAPQGTVTSLIAQHDHYYSKQGPFPCLTYESLADQLDANHLSWRYYSGPVKPGGAGYMWNAYDAIKSIRYGPDWQSDIVTPSKTVLTDVANGVLANVTWVTPSVPDSDHEWNGPDHGPSWVAQVVDAIGTSPMWKTTAIVIVWDDWGGHYDSVAPQQFGFGELGFRVPLLVVSPYVRAGTISHTPYEFGSILKFVEDNWGLHPMQAPDRRATSIGDVFDFSQKPRKFQPIPSQLSRRFFLNEPVTNLPGDN